MKADQGEKIIRYQNRYKQYSHLSFSNDFDRPMAINGLETRVLAALKTKGGFGVFDEGTKKKGLLRRSLLWHRSAKTPRLNRITFPAGRAISVVPSWSWMAYTGGIDYISPAFGGVDWAEMQSPWSDAGENGGARTEFQGGNIALVAEAQEYDLTLTRQGEGILHFDTPERSESLSTTLCVVLGREKPTATSLQKGLVHYVLIVKPTTSVDRNGNKVYERVGAGSLPGRAIGPSSGLTVTIH